VPVLNKFVASIATQLLLRYVLQSERNRIDCDLLARGAIWTLQLGQHQDPSGLELLAQEYTSVEEIST